MAIAKKIHIYLGSEIIALTLVVGISLTSVLFLFRLLQYSEYIFASGDGLMSIFLFIVFLFPNIFKVTIPLALFAGTALAVGRMSQDREIEAFMSCGLNPLKFCTVPVLLGFTACLISFSCSFYFEPLARREYVKFSWMFARHNVEYMIENRLHPRTFVSEPFKSGDTDVCLYVDWLSESRRQFKGVFLAMQNKNTRFSTVIIADSGSLRKEMRDGAFDYVFTIDKGRIYQPIDKSTSIATLLTTNADSIDKSALPADYALMRSFGRVPAVDWSITKFSKLEMSMVNLFRNQFAIPEQKKEDFRTRKFKTYVNLLKTIRNTPDWKKNRSNINEFNFFYEQMVIPISCIFLPIIGSLIGIYDPRRKAALIYVWVAVITFLFFFALMAAKEIPLRTSIPPEVVLYFPISILALLFVLFSLIRYYLPPSVGFFEACKILAQQGTHNLLKFVRRR